MIIEHDTRPCTPAGHSAFIGYDATAPGGKLAQLSPTGRVYTCPDCNRRFATSEARVVHDCKPRWAE